MCVLPFGVVFAFIIVPSLHARQLAWSLDRPISTVHNEVLHSDQVQAG